MHFLVDTSNGGRQYVTDPIDAPENVQRLIRDTVRAQPLGNDKGVRCTDCGSYISVGDTVKAYVIGDATGDNWKLAKVMHPDCGRLYSAENIARNDDTDAIVEGTLIHDPSVSAGGPDETHVTETENATFINAPRGTHRLEDPEVKAIHMMSDERRQERQETREMAEQLMDDMLNNEDSE